MSSAYRCLIRSLRARISSGVTRGFGGAGFEGLIVVGRCNTGFASGNGEDAPFSMVGGAGTLTRGLGALTGSRFGFTTALKLSRNPISEAFAVLVKKSFGQSRGIANTYHFR